MVVKHWSPAMVIGLGAAIGVFGAWRDVGGLQLTPIVAASALGTFTAGLVVGIVGALIT